MVYLPRPLGSPVAPAVILLGLLLHGGCTRSTDPRIVAVPEAAIAPASHISGVFSYPVAVATISAVFVRDLGLDPFPVSFTFYPNRMAFEAALLETGYDPSLARSTARTMSAIGGYRRVLLNEDALATLTWPARVLLLAHEMTHSLQYELGGGRRGASDQWLREGFADYLGMRVIDRLGALPLEDYRRRRLAEFRAAGMRDAPPLEAMRTFPEWVALAERDDLAVYARAFLAVDFLVERHGLPNVLDYFARFARSDDRAANFRAAFGESLAEFEAALGRRNKR